MLPKEGENKVIELIKWFFADQQNNGDIIKKKTLMVDGCAKFCVEIMVLEQ